MLPLDGAHPPRAREVIHWAERWHVTLDPSILWPGVDRPSFDVASAAIADVTKALIRGEASPPLRRPPHVTPRALGVAALASGMGPLLGYWIEKGRVLADPQAADILRRHLDHGRRRARLLERELVGLLDALDRHRISAVVLKGMHTGFRYFPEPGTRTIADIDLLVPRDQLGAAGLTLAELGFHQRRQTPRPIRSEWTRPHADIVHSVELDHSDNPWSVDLHVSLERYYFRGLRAGFEVPLGADRSQFVISGRRASGLPQPWLTAFLALHTAYDLTHLQLARLVELVFVIRNDLGSGALRWTDLRNLLEQSRAWRFVYPALDLVEALAPGTADAGILARLRAAATSRQHRVVAAIRESGMLRLPRRSLDDRFMWASGLPQLVCNLSDVLWPSHHSPLQAARLWGRRVSAALTGQVGISAPKPKVQTHRPH